MKENCYICISNTNGFCEIHGIDTRRNLCCNKYTPHHYKIGGIETLDYIKAKLTPVEYAGFLKGNILKYISRAGYKEDEVKDLNKAQVYLGILIAEKESNQNGNNR